MKTHTMTSRLPLVLLAASLLHPTSGAAAGGPPRNVFEGKGPHGQVWVSVELTRARTDQSFIPLLVAVRDDGPATTLDRSSFRIVAANGQVIPMASAAEIRAGYPMLLFDRTAVRFTGLPLGSLLDLSDLRPSGFFAGPGDGGRAASGVSLARGQWTVDLLYFPRPTGLVEGQTVSLNVTGTGWVTPVIVHFHL